MLPSLSAQDFVAKWRQVDLSERSAVQQHFLDLCALVGHPSPAEADPAGRDFAFEMGAEKTVGGQGWADVAKLGFFGWEYKGKHADLDKAYQQLLQYREALQNPPLLVVSDTERIVIHTNFTNTPKKVVTLTLDDLLTTDGLRTLRAVFFDPAYFKPGQTTQQVTEAAAAEFARLAELLQRYGAQPQPAAHFLIRLLFVLFAEDVGLLPAGILKKLVDQTRRNARDFSAVLRQLFGTMVKGGYFGAERIAHFDGGLFEDDTVLDLDSDALDILTRIDGFDWSSIEPSIFGTLFERGLDPSKRSQIGAHFTGKDDIVLIVEPVLMAPLRRRWAEVQAEARKLAEKRDRARGPQRNRLQGALRTLLMDFAREIANVKVLDPACGSGNFLYISLRLLLDLEKSVIDFADELFVGRFFPSVNVGQVMGIEINKFAYELAQTTIWIGFIQWHIQNGLGLPTEPILKPLHNIQHMGAILAYDAEGKPVEPEWPEADVVVGNPPFLGWFKLRQELGDKYVDDLRQLYADRIPGGADLVTYWFECARRMIASRMAGRADLLATNSIRGGANRAVLDNIVQSGAIFWAQSDRDWVLDGAAVRVSMVGFDAGVEQERSLDGRRVTAISPDLTAGLNLMAARGLSENQGICFLGAFKFGAFDVTGDTAETMLRLPPNPNGRPNHDVLFPWVNGLDIARRPRGMWIINFRDMSEEVAAQYEAPFEYVRRYVKPERIKNRRARRARFWWQHGETSPGLYAALDPLPRYIGMARVAKHRLLVWLKRPTVPDMQVIVFCRYDDYFLGVLHSKPHELWSLRQGTTLEDRPRYTPTTTFETFPFPFPPGQEPQDDPRVQAIAEAAAELVKLRDAWLNPPGARDAELKKRTLTNLYNQRPTWLDNAHRRLDEAVFAAYGWPADLSDDDILARLLALNLERAAAQGEAERGTAEDREDDEDE